MIGCKDTQCTHPPFKNKRALHIHETKMHSSKEDVELTEDSKTYVPSMAALDFGQVGQEVFSDRQDSSDSTTNKRFYKVVEWARAAVDVVARSCVSAGYHLSVKPYAKDLISPAKVILIDKFLEMPNEEDHLEDLVMDLVMDLLVFGEAYLRISYQDTDVPQFNRDFAKDKLDILDDIEFPFKLYVLDAEYMKPKSNGKKITGYVEKRNGKVINTYQPREIIHFKYPGPGTDVRGMSPFKTLQNAMATDIFSADYNAQFFTNNATPRIHIDLGRVGDKELRAFVARAQKNLKGKPHSSLVTTGGATVNPISVTNKDMEFNIYSKTIREKIFAVIGVQPAILGLVTDTRDLPHQIALFIDLTVRPMQKLIARRINRKVLREFFKKTPVDLVFNPITSLDVESYVLQVESDIKNLIRTRNEIRAERGLTPIKGGDVFILPYSDASMAVLDFDDNGNIIIPKNPDSQSSEPN